MSRVPTLTPSQLERVRPHATLRKVEAGQVLYAPNDPTPSAFVVVNGGLKIVAASAGGDRVVGTYAAGQFSGELLILAGRRSIYRCEATEAGILLELAPSELRALIAADGELGEVFMDAFLARRQALREAGHGTVILVGSSRSAETLLLREFLRRDGYPFSYADVDSDPAAPELLTRLGVLPGDIPVVVWNNDRVLQNPTPASLAQALGYNGDPDEARVRDLVIVGAGPAGLGAAVYAASEGLDVVVIEKSAPGGQAGASSKIENYLGFPTGLSGQELADRAIAQAEKFGARILVARGVSSLECQKRPYRITLCDGHEIQTRAIVLATGAQYNKPTIPNLDSFIGRGVHFSATHMEAQLCSGDEVVVIGGGNSAGQAALFLAQSGSRVQMLVRGKRLADTMSRYLVQRIESHALIRVAYQSELKALEGDARVERVTWRRANDDIEETRAIRHVFVMTGASPHTAWLAGCLALDDKGFVLAGQDWRKTTPPVPWPLEREPFMLETSLPGVFVVGDARSGSVKRVASAVGEGSVVVHLVHRALAAQVSAETARLDEASLPATPPRSTTSSPNPSRESTTMSTAKKVLFVITNSETAFWLSEVTHPYWHLTERGVTVDFASPKGGKVVYDPYSDPYFANSTEPDDLVSKGFLGEKQLAAKLDTTLKLKDVDLTRYDAIHVAGGRGATFDLYPNEDVAKALEHFWSRDKVVGAICHGAVALGNIPDRVRGRQLTGYTLEGDQELQRLFGKSFLIPHYPQTVLEETGAIYKRVGANDPYVIADGKLVTGQNQQSASEYALVLLRTMTGASPVSLAS